ANAYQAYQLSRYHFQQISPTDSIKSRALLEEAVRFDAGFAPAYAALAEQSVNEAITGQHTPAESFSKAKAALRRAADLNPSSAEFYAAAGFVDLVCDWNFKGAELNLRKSLELNPYYVYANNYLGQVFMFQCRFDEAETYSRRALEIEPMGLLNHNILTIAYFLARNYQKAIEECEKLLAVYPRFYVAAWMRCWVLEQTGRASEAIIEYEKILREPHGELARRWIGYAYALTGDRENALQTAAKIVAESLDHFVSQTHLAALYAALNEPDKAFFYLENALAERDPWMLWIAADPRFDNLRLDSRFDELVRRVGLNEAHTATDLKELRENLSSEENLERFTSSGSKNTTAVFQATTGNANLNTAEVQYSFSESIKQHKPLAALTALIDLFAATGFGYRFFAGRAANTKQIESVAVLPFVNVAADPETEYLSDGISESLIDRLSQLPQLKVIARSSSFKYRGEDIDLQDAAYKLGVQAIITGRVARRGDNLSIRVELIDVRDNRQLWSEQYHRRAADLLIIQQEIAQNVSEKLRLKLSGAQKQEIAKQTTVNPQAYELLLKGHSYRNKKGTENKMKAAAYYQQAMDVDPEY
ncbi:MAG TPA: hypothetical protein VGD05_03270, partial [Pyrinomonadaceae bacterium]